MARIKSLDKILDGLRSRVVEQRTDALDRLARYDWRASRPRRRQREQVFREVSLLLHGHPDEQVRWWAAYVLTSWFEKQSLLVLLDVLQNGGEAPRVRGQAAEGVGNVGQCIRLGRARDGAVEALRRGLRDPEPEVRFWSVYALGALEAREAAADIELLRQDGAAPPGWWSVGEEAVDVLRVFEEGVWPDRDRPLARGRDLP